MSIRWLTVFLDLPATDFGVAEEFWCRVTSSELSARRGPDDAFVSLLPAHGVACLRIQRVRAGGGGRHLDLHIDLAQESLAEAAGRAAALGAKVRQIEDGLIVLDSPGGFGFCLVDWNGETDVPEPEDFDGGGPARLDQLCLDIPAAGFETEALFWSDLTGWPRHSGSLPEFAYLERPGGVPIRILLQRRAEAAAQDQVTAHVDLACDDVAGLAERHVAAGARVLARYPGWVTLIDPAGQPYCHTGRDPRTGRVRVRS
jgi:hypothetical protein